MTPWIDRVQSVVEGICRRRRRSKPEATGKTWDMERTQSWGHAINWQDFATGTLVGHISPGPQSVRAGDDVICRMESGRVHRFRITKVEYKMDPMDMFFAQAVPIGYEDQERVMREVPDDAD